MREDYVTIEEIWVPCESGEGAGITRDGKHYQLAAIVSNGRPLYLSKDVVLENIKMTSQEFANKFPPSNPNTI